jgi:hypothetical protein
MGVGIFNHGYNMDIYVDVNISTRSRVESCASNFFEYSFLRQCPGVVLANDSILFQNEHTADLGISLLLLNATILHFVSIRIIMTAEAIILVISPRKGY